MTQAQPPAPPQPPGPSKPPDSARLAELLALLDGYVIRLVNKAREAKNRSEREGRPVELIIRFDSGVMFIGKVEPDGRENTA